MRFSIFLSNIVGLAVEGLSAPYRCSENMRDRGFFACAKIGVQICILASGWAVQSPDYWCQSF